METIPLTQKVCKACKNALPISCFYKNKLLSDGYLNICKQCCSEQSAKRYKQNSEKRKEKSREYRNKNVDECRERERRYAQNHREEKRAKTAQWRKKNPERKKELDRLWREQNIERKKETDRLYRLENRETILHQQREQGKERRKRVCQKCGVAGEPSKLFKFGSELCRECLLTLPKNQCLSCKISSLKLIRGYCSSCYHQSPIRRGICKQCGKEKRLISIKRQLCESCNEKNRKQRDPNFDMKKKLSNRLRTAFKIFSTKGKKTTSKKYGIDFQAIIEHLGSCPGKHEDYHIDHIIPLAAFDFDDLEQVIKAFAPENHQWLTKEENQRKGSNYNSEEFNAYLGRVD